MQQHLTLYGYLRAMHSYLKGMANEAVIFTVLK